MVLPVPGCWTSMQTSVWIKILKNCTITEWSGDGVCFCLLQNVSWRKYQGQQWGEASEKHCRHGPFFVHECVVITDIDAQNGEVGGGVN